jgi:hypothetical protein
MQTAVVVDAVEAERLLAVEEVMDEDAVGAVVVQL